MYEFYWWIVTLFGDPLIWTAIIAVLTITYFLLRRKKPMGKKAKRTRNVLKKFLLLLIPALIITFAGSELLKMSFQIPRPCVPCPAEGCNPHCPVNFSFPSGHTSTIAGIVTALVLVLGRRRYLLLYIIVFLVAASRVALGVHTIEDVAGGFAFGTFATMLVWKYRKRIYEWEDEIL